MRTAVDHHLLSRDAVGVGDGDRDQMAVGYGAALGICFPYPGGGWVLRRRSLYPTESAWYIVGFARAEDAIIQTGDGIHHEASQGYQYQAARVYGNGWVSDWTPPVRVDLDGATNVIAPPLPAAPVRITARPIEGGAYVVSWAYEDWGQGAWPTDFQVFADGDFNAALATVSFDARRKRFTYTTGPYADGSLHTFSVRARSSAGVAERNTYETAEQAAYASGPEAATIAGAGLRR